MKQITLKNFSAFFEQAATGTSFQAQIFSLNGGNLRVTCNWLYSALNIDPNDTTDFYWNISKVDDSHVSLSPYNSCIGKSIFASARDDYNWYFQVQAPFSADWITAVQRDEIIEMQIGDLMMTTFKGFNGRYMKQEDSIAFQGNHAGYRVSSIGDIEDDSTTWFLSIKQLFTKDYEWIEEKISLDELKSTLNNRKISIQTEKLNTLHKMINS